MFLSLGYMYTQQYKNKYPEPIMEGGVGPQKGWSAYLNASPAPTYDRHFPQITVPVPPFLGWCDS